MDFIYESALVSAHHERVHVSELQVQVEENVGISIGLPICVSGGGYDRPDSIGHVRGDRKCTMT